MKKRSVDDLKDALRYSVRPRMEGVALGICDLMECGVTIGGLHLRRYRRLKRLEKAISERIRTAEPKWWGDG